MDMNLLYFARGFLILLTAIFGFSDISGRTEKLCKAELSA